MLIVSLDKIYYQEYIEVKVFNKSASFDNKYLIYKMKKQMFVRKGKDWGKVGGCYQFGVSAARRGTGGGGCVGSKISI